MLAVTMQASETQPEIDRLAACGALRTWSVIVTVLGDFCRDRDDRVSGRALQAVLGRIGLSAASARVALHRLRRDGWIESEKRGRDAAYRLSAMGWRETEAARGRIYDSGPAVGSARLVVSPPTTAAPEFAALLPPEAVQIAPRCALLASVPGDLAPDLWVTGIAGEVPGWVAEAVAGADLRADYARLADAVTAVLNASVSPGDEAAARVLALHHWRRLRLRHSDLPDIVLGEAWEGARARRAVMAALARFARPDPDTLAP